MKKFLSKNLFHLFVFSVAMGFMESAVVIYLRELYYPDGFKLPLRTMPNHIMLTEVLREAATIIMLVGIGIITGKTKAQRFAYFIFCFAVWDIFYYVFLKMILNWPETILARDILFLIPVPWEGPVLAPCIVSLSLIIWAILIDWFSRNEIAIISKKQLGIFSIGSIIVITSFMRDYIVAWFSGSRIKLAGFDYMPESYNWWWFTIGQLMMLYAILIQNNFLERIYSGKKNLKPIWKKEEVNY